MGSWYLGVGIGGRSGENFVLVVGWGLLGVVRTLIY